MDDAAPPKRRNARGKGITVEPVIKEEEHEGSIDSGKTKAKGRAKTPVGRPKKGDKENTPGSGGSVEEEEPVEKVKKSTTRKTTGRKVKEEPASESDAAPVAKRATRATRTKA